MMDAVVGFTKEDGTTECVRDTVCCMIAGAKPALLGRLGMLGALRTSVCVCAPDLTTACGAPVLQVRNATNSQRATRIGRWVVAGSIGVLGRGTANARCSCMCQLVLPTYPPFLSSHSTTPMSQHDTHPTYPTLPAPPENIPPFHTAKRPKYRKTRKHRVSTVKLVEKYSKLPIPQFQLFRGPLYPLLQYKRTMEFLYSRLAQNPGQAIFQLE